MKADIKKIHKKILAGVVSLALLLRVFYGLDFVSEATGTKVICPTEATVTVGNADTNGVSDSSIVFSEVKEYNTDGGVFGLFSAYSDITSILNVLYNKNGSAIVLEFAEAIDVTQYNQMAINAFMGGWSDNTNTIKVNIYGSGVSDLTSENAVGHFTTSGNFNQEVSCTLDLTEYAEADGKVDNLTFCFETASTAESWLAFGAFRLSYVTPDTPDVELQEIAWESFGIEYATYTADTYVPSTSTTSMANTSFRGQVIFDKGQEADTYDYYICYGAQGNVWDGMRIAPLSAGTLRVYDPYDLSIDVTLTAPKSLENFVGTEFELGIDLWYSGDDAKVIIYIDGVQYNKTAYVWENAAKNNRVGNNVNFIVNGTGNKVIVGEEQPLEQLPSDFTELTLNDFGFTDGIYTEAAKQHLGINGTASLDHKILSVNISCEGGNMQLFYGAKDSDWSGLYFLFNPDENTNRITLTQGTDGPSYQFEASKGGFDLCNGNVIGLKITTEYVDGDSVNSDLKVGVFINGVLYDNQYITMSNFVSSISDGVSIHRADGVNGTMSISTPKRMLPSNYAQKTFVDVGIGDVTNRTGSGTSMAGTYIDWDGMIFSGKASFAEEGSEIRFGASEGGWVGAQLILKNDMLTFNHAAGTFGDLAVWSDINANDTFRFSLVTKYVDMDGNSEQDMQLGLWVDGEMYGNRWFYILDYTMYEGDQYAISFCMNNGTCSLESYLPSTETGTRDNGKYYYNLVEGGYLLSTGGTITVNGEEKQNGDVLSLAGDYNIVRTEGNVEYNSTVVLYQIGDIHPDGMISAADLIAAKKLVGQMSIATEAGLKGADVNWDNKVNDSDLVKIRHVLVGKDTIDMAAGASSLSFSSGDVKEMPIGGYYGAYGSLLTQEVYKKIKDSGINLVTWSIDTYNASGETENVIKQLELAEESGVSLFIRDGALLNTNKQYTAKELADMIAEYSMYQSFKGFTIVDEPSATDGTYATDRPLNDYDALSSSVNSYVNLNAYTNLYPLASDLGDSDAYENYLDEYCRTYNPKMLSFDDYPFNEGNSVQVTSCTQYFENLAMVRNKAMEYNIPFWTFVQAGKWFNTTSWFSEGLTLAQMRWNANMALAFGAKGIQYFPLVEPIEDEIDFSGNGLIDSTGNTTEWYSYAQSINAQIAAVDEVLMNSINMGVMLDGTYAERNIKNCGVTILDEFREVTAISSDDISYTEYGVVVGCFDYYGKTSLYVVNYNTNGANNVTLSFNDTYSTQTITSSGVTEASGNSLKFNLAAGEAALVVIE